MSGIRVEGRFKDFPLPDGLTRKEIIRFAGRYMCKRVKFYTPVRTGRLKKGWKCSAGTNVFKLTNRVKYASYLDSGITLAKNRTKGFMYNRALRDTIKRVKSRFNIDLSTYVSISRVE